MLPFFKDLVLVLLLLSEPDCWLIVNPQDLFLLPFFFFSFTKISKVFNSGTKVFEIFTEAGLKSTISVLFEQSKQV